MEYRTVMQDACEEFIEKKSRFLGYCRPVQSEQQALDFLAQVSAQHKEANHHVYAYVLRENHLMRYSDDGEPQGTAGTPVLSVLQKAQLTDVAVVVVRYFGGILLGGGGLVRAYSHTASLSVQAAKIVTMKPCKLVQLCCDYGFYGKVQHLLGQAECPMDDVQFGENVTVRFHMEAQPLAALTKALAEASAGKYLPEELDERFFAFL